MILCSTSQKLPSSKWFTPSTFYCAIFLFMMSYLCKAECLVVAAMKRKYNVKSQHRTEMRVAMVSLIPKFDKLVQ